MNEQELKHIIKQGENQKVEFKANFGSKAILAINALTNSDGGMILIGVSDSGTIKGADYNKESVQQWLNEIKQKTEPSIVPKVEIFKIDTKHVIAIIVPEYPIKPLAYQGRYYVRRNNANHTLTVDEIVDLRVESMNSSFDAFEVDTTMDDLDQAALTYFIQKISQSGRFKSTDNIMNDLTKLGFVNKGKLTRAAELLFGIHHTSIHIGRFKSAATIIDDLLIKEPLIMAVEEVMNFIKRNIRIEYEFTGELSREEKWQYPLQAIRELVLNAIIHRDYRNPTDVIIKIYDDSILFSNPGNLFGDNSIEDLNTDNYQPRHRNKLLAEAFYLMGEVEKYGTGFVRIRKWLKGYPMLHYVIEDLGDFIRVNLTAKTKLSEEIIERKVDELNEGIDEGINEGISEGIKILYNYIKTNPGMRVVQLEKDLQVPAKTLERWISSLRKQDVIIFKGSKKAGGYYEKK